jgi:hypothetical protein
VGGKNKLLVATVLTCALLITAAAVAVSILALSRGKEDEGAVQAESGSQQTQEKSGQDEGGQKSDSTAKGEQAGGNAGASGQKPPESQPETTSSTGRTDLVPAQIPASSVDEYLLRQAALDYMATTLGGSGAYQITQIKISAIDPAWGKVTFYRKDQDLTTETLFYKQGGNWAPAQIGPGTPAMPTDL